MSVVIPSQSNQSSEPSEKPKMGLLIGQSFSTVLWRSAQIYVFWFLVFAVSGFLYNEVIVSESMQRYTGYSRRRSAAAYQDGTENEENTDAFDLVDNGESLTFENHQIMSFATTAAFCVLSLRVIFETIHLNIGGETSALLSGNTLEDRKEDDGDSEDEDTDYHQDTVEQVQVQPIPQNMQPPPTLSQLPPTQQPIYVLPQPVQSQPVQPVQPVQVVQQPAPVYSQNVHVQKRRHHKKR